MRVGENRQIRSPGLDSGRDESGRDAANRFGEILRAHVDERIAVAIGERGPIRMFPSRPSTVHP